MTEVTLYKLTDIAGYSRNDTRWGENVTHTAKGTRQPPQLCSKDLIHAYLSPELAVLLNPIHNNYFSFRIWKARGEIVINDHNIKVGVKSLTTIKEIPIPEFTNEQKVKFAILCALEVFKDKEFYTWAQSWLDNKDRSLGAAYTAAYNAADAADAARAAYNAADAADAAYAAARAAHAADADAAYAAARAAHAARAVYAAHTDAAARAADADAAYAAARAAHAARAVYAAHTDAAARAADAADAAARAADAITNTDNKFDLVSIAKSI